MFVTQGKSILKGAPQLWYLKYLSLDKKHLKFLNQDFRFSFQKRYSLGKE